MSALKCVVARLDIKRPRAGHRTLIELITPSFSMVDVTIDGDRVRFEVEGWDKLWSLKSQLEIPVSHIASARVDPEPARGWWHGIKLPGTNLPGVITAGTFYQSEGAVFFDVHDPERTIVIELEHEHYKRLVLEVDDPDAVVARIRAAVVALRT
jgi:hypothetical protein